jgi:hypothetical protein
MRSHIRNGSGKYLFYGVIRHSGGGGMLDWGCVHQEEQAKDPRLPAFPNVVDLGRRLRALPFLPPHIEDTYLIGERQGVIPKPQEAECHHVPLIQSYSKVRRVSPGRASGVRGGRMIFTHLCSESVSGQGQSPFLHQGRRRQRLKLGLTCPPQPQCSSPAT